MLEGVVCVLFQRTAITQWSWVHRSNLSRSSWLALLAKTFMMETQSLLWVSMSVCLFLCAFFLCMCVCVVFMCLLSVCVCVCMFMCFLSGCVCVVFLCAFFLVVCVCLCMCVWWFVCVCGVFVCSPSGCLCVFVCSPSGCVCVFVWCFCVFPNVCVCVCGVFLCFLSHCLPFCPFLCSFLSWPPVSSDSHFDVRRTLLDFSLIQPTWLTFSIN